MVISDGAGKVSASTISNIEVGYLAGTNDLIQNQLDSKANQLTTYSKTEVDDNIYTKTEVDDNIYTKTEADALLNDEANQSTTYSKTEVDDNIYTKTEVDISLSSKANQSTTYTITDTDVLLNSK